MLYNFFEDSPAASSQWRLILNEIAGGENLQGAPTFDETRHASICAEVRLSRRETLFLPDSCRLVRQLKFLYVAVTRARQNLWITDSSESAEPMKVPRTF
jgi:superfamily I DNA/RNA helicase